MIKPVRFLVATGLFAALLLGAAATMVSASFQGASQSTSLEGVDSISITGFGRAVITIGSPAELTITGPQEVIDQINVAIQEDELEIQPGPNTDIQLAPDQELRYDITIPSLDDITLRGAVSLETTGIQGEELDVTLEGAATGTVSDVQLSELDAELRGASLLTVTGTTDQLDVEGREASTFDGSGLTAQSADIEARDAAHIIVNASGRLEVEARAAAIVEYVGEPGETEFEMRDAGTIRPFTGSPVESTQVAGTPVAATPVAGASPAATTGKAATTHEIHLAGQTFTPDTLEITVGEEVTWINDDDADHTITASDGTFDSGEHAEGETFSYTFDTAGKFPYFCAFHPEMQGMIVVVEGQ